MSNPRELDIKDPKKNTPRRTSEHGKKRKGGVLPTPGIDKIEMCPEKQLTSLDKAEILRTRTQDIPLAQVALITGLNQTQVEQNMSGYELEIAKEFNGGDEKPKLPVSEDDKLNIEFTKSLIDLGLITRDISAWQELHKLYESRQRPLSKNIFDQLRLEALFTAYRVAESSMSPALLNKYREAVNKMASVNFTSKLFLEEKFVKSEVCSMWQYDGEDNIGLYFYNKYREKSYQVVGEGEGGKIYETSKRLQSRSMSRWRGSGEKDLSGYRSWYD